MTSIPEKSRNNTEKMTIIFSRVFDIVNQQLTSLDFHFTRWWMNGKVFTILSPRSFVECSRIMAAKTL